MSILNKFKKIPPSGLRSQLVFGIASILVLGISLSIMDMVSRQRAFFLNLNHDRGVENAENLANIATSHVFANELDGLQNLVNIYKQKPGLEYAMVLSSDGIVLAHTDKKYLGLEPRDSISEKLKPINATQILLENDDIFDVASPIVHNDQIIGWVRIGMSQKYLESNITEIKRRGFLFIMISLILGIVFGVIIGGQLSKGLRKLVNAAKRIKEGDRDLRVVPTNSIEVTQLGIAINQMLDDISANEKLLRMVLENMPVGIWILDAQGNIISVNPAGKEMWKGVEYVGVDEYTVYKGWFTETGKELRSEDWGAAIVLTEGRPVINQEIEIECFDKSHKIVLNSAIPLRDDHEKIVGVITINVDITDRKNAEDNLRKINHAIGERVKELNCLYRLSELSNDPLKTIEHILQECANIIPPSYQYPEITCARIVFKGQTFESENFRESDWKQAANIIKDGTVAGKVEVFYKQQVKEEDEGPFLKEERLLINSIADILGSSAEKRMAEAVIKEQAEIFSAIIENANEAIWLLSPDLTVLQFNKTAKERLKLRRGIDTYPGANFKDSLHPGAEDSFIAMFEEANAGKYVERETYQKDIQGEMFWLRTKMYPIYDSHKTLMGITVLAENITDRKIAEQELEQSEANYRQLFDNSPASMWVINEKTSAIMQVNKACTRNYGYSEEEFLGMTITEISPGQSAFAAKTGMDDLFFMGSQQHVKKSGELIDVVTSSIPVKLNDEKSILLIAIDVTEKNLYEQKLTKAAIKVQEDERYEIGGELHDNVCQLLAGSLMFLGVIKRSLPEESMAMFDRTHQTISMATDEIRNLSHRLAPAFFDQETLEEVLKRLLDTFNVENNYKISLNVSNEIARRSLGHELQLNLYRILQEQLRNIMKHAKATDISVAITMEGDILKMRIADNGIGFDAKTGKGGIGLANMNRRVQLFSGSFMIYSSIGNGCEVLVDIPLID